MFALVTSKPDSIIVVQTKMSILPEKKERTIGSSSLLGIFPLTPSILTFLNLFLILFIIIGIDLMSLWRK